MDAFVDGQAGVVFEGSVAFGKATGEPFRPVDQHLMFCDLTLSIADERTLACTTLETTRKVKLILVIARTTVAREGMATLGAGPGGGGRTMVGAKVARQLGTVQELTDKISGERKITALQIQKLHKLTYLPLNCLPHPVA